jgi:hypothetical protein
MPLIKKASKKAFEHNVRAEMEAHPDKRAQDLAIAYSVQRKAKKKHMAEGGPVSAKAEKRPMPDQRGEDKAEVAHNSSDKALHQAGWSARPTEKQATHKPKVARITVPKMVPSSVINARLHKHEDDLEASMPPASPKEQPARDMDEEGAKRQGPPVHKMKMLAKGGMINEEVSMHDAEEDMVEHPAHLEEDDDQMSPAHDEFMADHMKMLAEGGELHHEMDEQPEEEEMLEHHASIAAAIMAKREAAKALHSGSEDEDEAEMYADGGEVAGRRHHEIPSHESIYTHEDADQADLSRNADEDANEEDQLSFNAIKKENYSESAGLDALDQPMDSNEHGDEREHESEDKHDSHLVNAVRRRMKMRSPITR